jgi:hypothetical protein
LLLLFIPNNDSLWIDEGQTIKYTRLDSFSDFWVTLLQDSNSEAQMPLGILIPWIAAKFIGTSELAQRCLNLIWIATACLLFRGISKIIRAPWLVLFFAIQPYLWFYTAEIRPYAMQILGSTLLAWSVVKAIYANPQSYHWFYIFWLGSFFLCSTSMLGAVTTGSCFLFLAVYLHFTLNWNPNFKQTLLLTGYWISLGVLGVYYLWTLLKGAGGAKVWQLGIKNILFSVYEILGFSGLGPDRQLLRETGRNGFDVIISQLAPHSIGLTILSCLYLLLLIIGCKHLPTTDQRKKTLVFVCGGVFTLSIAVMFTAAYCAKFPFWGRHLAPAFAFWVIFSGALFSVWMNAHPKIAKIWLGLTITVLLYSSLTLRFNAHYRHDDYRTATTWAIQALQQGKTVWWAADIPTAIYYHVPVKSDSNTNGILDARNIDAGQISISKIPDTIIVSKPDLYDFNGSIKNYLIKNNFLLIHEAKAFKLYQR